ncbi:MAG: TatD family deoxyribonuclease [Ruminococcaceae bacterium]|nr:TatD family deoxyribonuclease [Oscillospiraceae bacterium]
MFIDAHAHYEDEAFDADRVEIFEKIQKAGCEAVIDAAQDVKTAELILSMAEQYPFLYANIGVHPHCAALFKDEDMGEIEEMAKHPKCVAVGEIGLDYHYDFSPRDRQKQVFREHIRLARKISKPVVVHDREAHQDTLDILQEEKADECGCLIHCYSGSREMAKIIMKRDYYVSIGGAVTFKNARHIIEALEVIPLERILLETDCPYMTPVPYRGKRNDSELIPFTAKKIAEIKSVSLDSVFEITRNNTKDFFGLK